MDEYLYLWAEWGILEKDYYKKVKDAFGDLKRAWKEITPVFLRDVLKFEPDKTERVWTYRSQLDFQSFARRLSACGARLYFIEDSDYPEPLKNLNKHYPPVFLYVRGTIPPLHKALAVVGTRRMTPYGKAATESLVADLARNEFVIISGLALGVDACAHRTALEYGALTAAVLGSGVDQIYPGSNLILARQILQSGGALISEFPLGTQPMKHHFPQRNRIIAGLSRGVLVTEGDVKSGALQTARIGNNEGRLIFAVPSSLSKKILSGTNFLIKNSEAKLVETVGDILDDFQMKAKDFKKDPADFNENETQILHLISNGGKSMDDLVSETRLGIPELSEILIHLQLKDAIREMGYRWILK